VDHEQAERLISERLDGERLQPKALVALERHLESCAECRAFERGAYRLREAARFEVVPAVPDLVEPIMGAVEAETGSRRDGLRVVRPMRLPARRRRVRWLAPLVAAAVAGALVGSLVVGGPWSSTDAPPKGSALAAEAVADGVAGAAAGLTAYHATFAITEHHLSPEVPLRELAMRVWFRAPERFRLDVVDRTDYPSPATPTDLRLIVDGDAWYLSAPAPCPSATCPPRETAIRNRVPFSSAAPAPTDLVLPLTALADPASIEVVGRDSVLGHPAVVVQLPFERAAPLFPFLSLGGDWRPFFPNDRVRIWLDASSWFPLRWQVFPAGGHERDAWALRFGLPEEPSRDPVFEVDARSVDLERPPADVFVAPADATAEDQGAQVVRADELAARIGFDPLAPAALAGLDRYRAVIPAAGTADGAGPIVTYADGLSFLKLGETRTWSGDAPFGPVGVRAEEVRIAGGGVAYYEPATADHGRRLSIHAAGTDLFLETNLPRASLLAAAATLPVVGLPMPESWRVRTTAGATVERVSLERAAAEVPFPVAAPETLPPGFVLASVELARVGSDAGVTMYFRGAEVDAAGPIRLHLEAAASLPPASAPEQSTIEVAGARGRWTPDRSLLEWDVGGVYRSLDAPGLGLDALLAIAASIPVPDAIAPADR
jgi:hypothetical protein